jgi:hypothetical protein
MTKMDFRIILYIFKSCISVLFYLLRDSKFVQCTINVQKFNKISFFYVFLTAHLRIDLVHLPTLMHNSFIH